AGALALDAGVDLSLWDDGFTHLAEAVERGLVSETALDTAVTRVLRLKFRLGLFEHPYTGRAQGATGGVPEFPHTGRVPGLAAGASAFPNAGRVQGATGGAAEFPHAGRAPMPAAGASEQPPRAPRAPRAPSPDAGRELSLGLARACVTLLQNRAGVLPVGPAVRRIAVLGPHAGTTAHQLGDYTAPQRPGTGASVLDGLRRLAPPGVEVRHARGCALTGDDRAGIPEAVAAAAASDLAVLVLGGSSARTPGTEFDANGAARTVVSEMTCGEGVDLAGLRLGEAQYALLDAVAATGTPTAVVLVQGRPHAVPEAVERADALLTAWYPGPWGGEAVAEVLLGITEPAGRLPVSVPRSAAQLPVYYNHKDTEYRSYADESAEPLFSFGHGLSYTTFEYGEPRLPGRDVVEVDVTNTGGRHGRTVVQVYVRRLRTPVWPRTLELCAFEGVTLAPGECRTVAVRLTAVSGAVEVRVAASAREALAATPLKTDQSFTAPDETPL
ncbi:glycoside hydrolase family 3 C-terminal domain-containing protein, partial [Streptomyces sp. NPDC002920]